MHARRIVACSALSAALLVACDPGISTLAWSVEIADDALASRAEIIEAHIHRGGCDSIGGEPLYSAQRRRGDDAAPMAPGALEPGTYAFSARARDGACAWIAEACVEIELPLADAETVRVRLEGRVEPERACAREECWDSVCVDREDPGTPCGAGVVTDLTCRADGGGQLLDVCRRADPVIIDGVPGELRRATPIRVRRDDLSATFRLEWDCTALYVGAIVSDTELSALLEQPAPDRDPRDLYATDSIEVLLDVESTHADRPDGDDRHVIVNLAGIVGDAEGGVGSLPWWDASAFDIPDLRREVTLQGSAGDGEPDEGWMVEVAIPWSALGLPECPDAGRVLGLDLAINDQRQADGSTTHRTADWAGLTMYANPDQWNCIRLRDDDGS